MSFEDHGKSYDAVHDQHHTSGWLHERFGSNFRLTELQSAIGRIQLRRLAEWTSIRTRNALLLRDALSDCSALHIPFPPDNIVHAWYKFYAFVNPDALSDGYSRDRIISEISSLGFPAFSGSCSEIYLEKCFLNTSFQPSNRLPVARKLGETSLMFLVHPTITLQQMADYVEAIRSVVLKATR